MINDSNNKPDFTKKSFSLYVNSGALLLTIVGALNWGLIGISGCNAVETLFSSLPHISRLIYILVGISGLYLSFNFLKFYTKDF